MEYGRSEDLDSIRKMMHAEESVDLAYEEKSWGLDEVWIWTR